MLRTLASCWNRENFEVKIEESEKAGSHNQCSTCTYRGLWGLVVVRLS